jgi:hypothetical protein
LLRLGFGEYFDAAASTKIFRIPASSTEQFGKLGRAMQRVDLARPTLVYVAEKL